MGSNRTVSPIEVSRQLLTGLASAQTAAVHHLISSDAFMQIWFGNVNQTYNSRPQVCQGLVEQTNSWPNKLFFNVQAWDDNDDSVNVQFDIWDRPNGRVLHTNCYLSITLHKDKIKSIKLYQGQLFDA